MEKPDIEFIETIRNSIRYEKRRKNKKIIVLSLILALILAVSFILLAFVEHKIVYGAETKDPVLWSEILEPLAFCESSNNPMAVNPDEPHGESFGLYQFRIDTFNHFGERYGLPHDDIFNPKQQESIVIEMLREGRAEHWEKCLSD